MLDPGHVAHWYAAWLVEWTGSEARLLWPARGLARVCMRMPVPSSGAARPYATNLARNRQVLAVTPARGQPARVACRTAQARPACAPECEPWCPRRPCWAPPGRLTGAPRRPRRPAAAGRPRRVRAGLRRAVHAAGRGELPGGGAAAARRPPRSPRQRPGTPRHAPTASVRRLRGQPRGGRAHAPRPRGRRAGPP